MGNNQSSASVTQKNNIITVNKSVVELLNQQINKTTSDTIVNQATSCGASSSTTVLALFQDIIAKGDINIDNTMNSKVTVNISCVNASTVATTVGTDVSTSMVGQIETAFKTLNDQAASGTASSSTSTGFNPFAALMNTASASDVKQYNTATTTNDSQTIVKSMIQNITANTFTTNVLNELKANVVSAMSVQYKNLQAGGNVNITNLMNNTTDIIAQQVVQMGIGNTVTTKLLQTFNVDVTTETDTTTTQTATAEAEAKSTIAGLFDFSLGSTNSSSSSCSLLCICIICIILMGLVSQLSG